MKVPNEKSTRVTVLLRPDQKKILLSKSKKRGANISQIVRDILDEKFSLNVS